jgi:hypothetical protein
MRDRLCRSTLSAKYKARAENEVYMYEEQRLDGNSMREFGKSIMFTNVLVALRSSA